MTSPALLSSRKRVDRVVDMMVEDMMVVDMMVVDITSTVPHTLSATTTVSSRKLHFVLSGVLHSWN